MMFVIFRLFRLDGAARDEFLKVRFSKEQRDAIGLLWIAVSHNTNPATTLPRILDILYLLAS